MKTVLMFELLNCPYCHQAHRYIEALKAEHPEYRDIPMRIVDEAKQVDYANSFDYWYVPTFYVDGQKLHEGVPSKQKVQAVLDAALE